MSRIGDLITRLCPDGVEFKALGDVADFQRGSAMTIRSAVPGQYPLVANSPEPIGTHIESNREGEFLVVARSGAGAGTVSRWRGPLFLTDAFSVHPHPDVMTTGFAYYLLQSQQVALREMKAGGGVPHVRVKEVQAFRIPVPPLAIQAEIAGTLKQFTELDSALSEERELRQAQRKELARRLIVTAGHGLNKSHGGERVRLADIATQFVDPVGVRPEATYTTLGVRWYGEGAFERDPRVGSSIKGATLYRVKPGQLIFNRMFVTEGSFALIPDDLGEAVVSNEFPAYDLDRSRVLPEWLLLFLLDEYTLKRIEAQTTGTERGTMKSRRRWKEAQFTTFEIDLPPLEVQRKAAAAVGAAKDLEAVLREEQTARRMQYDYYRDKLLTFKETE